MTSIIRSNEIIVASMAWNLDAIEQTQLWRQHRVDGVGRLKFDSHTGRDGSLTKAMPRPQEMGVDASRS